MHGDWASLDGIFDYDFDDSDNIWHCDGCGEPTHLNELNDFPELCDVDAVYWPMFCSECFEKMKRRREADSKCNWIKEGF